MSRSPSERSEPARDLLQQAVAGVVAERVVDLLEVVEVDQHHGRGDVRAAAGGDRLLDAVAEERAVGQAGQRVVQRLVLLGDRRAPAAVDGEERQQQQQQRGQAELGGQHDDGREAEQQAGGRGLEEEVVGQVAAELDDALRERDDGRDERAVDDEEDRRDAEDRRSGPSGPNGSAPASRDVGERPARSEAAATEIAYCAALKAIFLTGLPLIVSAMMLAPSRPAMRDGGAAGQHQREREAGRGGDLALGPARVDLQRDELAHEGAEGEEGQLRVEELVEGVEARAEHEHGAGGARRRPPASRRDRVGGGGGARVRVSVEEGGSARVPCPDNRTCAAVAGTLVLTTCGRSLRSCVFLRAGSKSVDDRAERSAPLHPSAEALQEHGDDARGERHPVQAQLH